MTSPLDKLGTERISRLIFRYSAPAILSTLIDAAYNAADRIFVGRVCGEDALAAITVCFSPTLFTLAVSMTIGQGAATVMSIALGAGKRELAEKYLAQAFVLFAFVSILAACVGMPFLPQILTLFGATEKILLDACAYFSVILAGMVFDQISYGINNLIRVEGRPVLAMSVILVGGLTNVALDWLFLVVFGWGVRGAALATITAQACASAVVLVYYFGGFSVLKVRRKNIFPSVAEVRAILSAGSPAFILQTLAAVAVSVMVLQARKYGAEPALTVIGVCATVTFFLFLPVVGLSMGVQPIIGYNWGAENLKRVRRAFGRALFFATLICTSGFLVAEICPRAIFNIFLGEESALLDMGETALRLMVAGYPFIGINIIASGYFQSTKRPRISITLTMLRQLAFLVPAMLVLPHFFGLNGLWASFPVGDFSAFLATLVFVLIERRRVFGRLD